MPAYQVSTSVAGPTTPIRINLRRFKYGVGLLVTVPSGVTALVNVEVTGDPVDRTGGSSLVGAGPYPDTGPRNWNLHDVLNQLTASKNSSLAYPITAIRLNPANVSGGTVTLSVVEADG
jgi:hypothetical protein